METTTVSSAMRQSGMRAFGGIAAFLLVIVYGAALVYAGVRTYDLFRLTLPPDLLPLAVVGLLAMEVLAVALPIGLHFWFAPGMQHVLGTLFYVTDLALLGANAILDAAHNTGAILPEFMAAYGVYVVPALPIYALVVVAVLWATDTGSRRRHMIEAVRAATEEAWMSQIQRATEHVDITGAIEVAAAESARALVGETLGRVPRGGALPAPALRAEVEPDAADDDDHAAPVLVRAGNGTRRRARQEADAAGPK